MPRGKELEQLPASNIAPGAGKDAGRFQHKIIEGMEQNEQPMPSNVEKENEDMI